MATKLYADIGNFSAGILAFKFDKAPICDRGYCQSVPEPSGVLGLAVVGLAIAGHQIRSKTKL